jgi:alanine racemase
MHPTRAVIRLDNLSHNMALLREVAGGRPLWPAIKANAYGHGAGIIARHLAGLGYHTLCVAHLSEAQALLDAGVDATFVILSASLPEQATGMVAARCEPVICTFEMADALSREAVAAGREVAVHIKIDTGMGRVGVYPEEASAFVHHCRGLKGLWVKGLMSHFPRADEADKSFSLEQVERFRQAIAAVGDQDIEVRHMANSAGILDIPTAHFDVARPGIAIYGLAPSAEIANPRVKDLRPVLEWRSRITFLKEVPGGHGISYGHSFVTDTPSLIATVPVGYGDGLSRRLSDTMEMLVDGVRCPQVGRITMDQTLLDVTALRGRVQLGDDVVIIGAQGAERITADELAAKLGTINYEIVTAISARVKREAVSGA